MTESTPTRPARAGTRTGIPRDCLYRLPEGLLHLMRTWPVDRDALRLLHVLLYRTCRACQDWRGGSDPQPEAGYREAFRDVHDWQGTRPDRGNGALLAAMARLRATGAFARLEAHDGNRALRWRLTDKAFAMLFADDTFGYLDIRILPHLRDALALRLLGETALVRGMRRPEVQLDVEDLHRVSGLEGPRVWKTVRRPLLAALAAIGAYHGLRLVIGLACHHRLAGIDTIHVRIEHAGTVWRTTALGQFHHRVREIIVIDGTGEHRLRPDALPASLAGRMRMPA